MPVGTVGSVKGLAPWELKAMGAGVVLGNTYHLHLRPGEALVEQRGELHRFVAWDGPMLTDSGGFQVFSLAALNQTPGVAFRSHRRLEAVRHPRRDDQRALGADIIASMSARQPTLSSRSSRRAWADGALADAASASIARSRRCLASYRAASTSCAARGQICSRDLPGFALGGLSVGETRGDVRGPRSDRTSATSDARYLMGVGTRTDGGGGGAGNRYVRLRAAGATAGWYGDDLGGRVNIKGALR